jgi:hypothetical protein
MTFAEQFSYVKSYVQHAFDNSTSDNCKDPIPVDAKEMMKMLEDTNPYFPP